MQSTTAAKWQADAASSNAVPDGGVEAQPLPEMERDAAREKGLHESSPTGHDCSVITRRAGCAVGLSTHFGKRRSLRDH
jgi:hypothetical protein